LFFQMACEPTRAFSRITKNSLDRLIGTRIAD